jgi:hypothetical protein
MEVLMETDIPFFAVLPSCNYFRAFVTGGHVTGMFIRILRYFQAHRGDPEVDLKEITYALRHPISHQIPSKVVPGHGYSEWITEMQYKGAHLFRTYQEGNFFIAFMDKNGKIFSYTGNHNAPYNPAFHLFDRYCKAILLAHPFYGFNVLRNFKAERTNYAIEKWEKRRGPQHIHLTNWPER